MGVSNKISSVKTGFLFLLLILLVSCDQKTFDTEEEMWTYLKDESNGYMQKKNVSGYDFSLLYRPTDLLVKQELDSVSNEKIKVLRDKYSQYMYINLSMSKNNKELLSTAPKNRNEFGAMVNQLAFGMNEMVHLYTSKKDTIEMLDFIYPRMYGMSNSTSIMFVFPRDKKYLDEEYLNFTVEDLGLFTGEVKFKIPIKKIYKEPILNFNK